MITVVSRWENDPNIATLEYRLWRQLSNFGIDRFVFVPKIKELSNLGIEQYDTMEEALNHVPDGNRVFLESTGHNSMNDLPPRDEDVVFILANVVDTLTLVGTLLKFQGNRTVLDKAAFTLTIYDTDRVTPIRVFDLREFGVGPSISTITERLPVSGSPLTP